LRKFKFYYNLTRITGTLHEDKYTFLIISRLVLPTINNVSDEVVEEIKTHILYPMTFFENNAVYEIMWKNTVQPGRPQMIK
jgi:hypothetical protein